MEAGREAVNEMKSSKNPGHDGFLVEGANKCERNNLRGISLFSVVGMLFGRLLIKRVQTRTECEIGEE